LGARSNSFNQTAASFKNNSLSNHSYITDANGKNATQVNLLHFTNYDTKEANNAIAGRPVFSDFFSNAANMNNVGQFTAIDFAYGFKSVLISPVPEPTSIALMLAGLGVVAVARRRTQVK
jgi:hypothetical protein